MDRRRVQAAGLHYCSDDDKVTYCTDRHPQARGRCYNLSSSRPLVQYGASGALLRLLALILRIHISLVAHLHDLSLASVPVSRVAGTGTLSARSSSGEPLLPGMSFKKGRSSTRQQEQAAGGTLFSSLEALQGFSHPSACFYIAIHHIARVSASNRSHSNPSAVQPSDHPRTACRPGEGELAPIRP